MGSSESSIHGMDIQGGGKCWIKVQTQEDILGWEYGVEGEKALKTKHLVRALWSSVFSFVKIREMDQVISKLLRRLTFWDFCFTM